MTRTERGIEVLLWPLVVNGFQLVAVVGLAQVIAHIHVAIDRSAWKPIDTELWQLQSGNWIAYSNNLYVGHSPHPATLLGYAATLVLLALLAAWLPVRKAHGWNAVAPVRRRTTIAVAAIVGVATPMIAVAWLPVMPPQFWWPVDAHQGTDNQMTVPDIILRSPDDLTPRSPGALLMGVATVLITWLVWRIGTLRLVRAPAPPMARPTVEEPPDPTST